MLRRVMRVPAVFDPDRGVSHARVTFHKDSYLKSGLHHILVVAS